MPEDGHRKLICAAYARKMRERLRTCAAYEFRRAADSGQTCPKSAQTIALTEFSFGSKTLVAAATHMTGLHATTRQDGAEPGRESASLLSRQGLTDDRIAEARRVWSQEYGRVISEAEAVEILRNVRRLAEVLWHAVEERQKQ